MPRRPARRRRLYSDKLVAPERLVPQRVQHFQRRGHAQRRLEPPRHEERHEVAEVHRRRRRAPARVQVQALARLRRRQDLLEVAVAEEEPLPSSSFFLPN